jgi:DNA-binding GntR family transcriptional regulator
MDDLCGGAIVEHAPQSNGTLASSVFAQLREDILNCRLEPGSKLRLQHLASEYGVGNSPLREALNRLSSIGLVTREENKGFRVSTASVAELQELIRTRCMLEETALKASIANGDDDWEAGVVLSFHRLNRLEQVTANGNEHRTPEWEIAHLDYHVALLSACGSHILLDFCRQLHEQTLRYRSLVEVVEYRDVHECSEHRKIQEAVLARDVERAVEMLHSHYSVTLEIILKSGALD